MSHPHADVHGDEEHPHKKTIDRLIYMANQINWFFKSQPQEKRVPGVVDHIQHFWDPRMKAEIFAHVGNGGGGLEPLALEAVQILKAAHEGKKQTFGEAERVATSEPRTGEAPPHVTHEGRG